MLKFSGLGTFFPTSTEKCHFFSSCFTFNNPACAERSSSMWDLPIFMTWDGSICLGPGWLLGLKGMLAVGLRIMPACTGRAMAPAVGAHVTLTAGAWLPQSPDAMAGRGALPPIIPAQKPNTLRYQHIIRTALTLLLPEELHSQQYQCSSFTQSMLYHHSCPSRCAKLQNDALCCLVKGLETVIHLTGGRPFYHFRNAAQSKCSHV